MLKKLNLKEEVKKQETKEAEQHAKYEEHAARQEMHIERLVDIMKTLVKHLMQQ